LRGFCFFGATLRNWFFIFWIFILTLPIRADITIGVVGPLTGASAAFGANMLAGVNAAVDELNQQGGIDGQFISVSSFDDACDVKLAEAAAKQLIEKQVAVVIGHFCSFPSLAAAKLYEAAGIAMIAPSPSLPVLTESGLGSIFRLSARDDGQGTFAAKRMVQEYASSNIAVLNDGTAANVALSKTFLAALPAAPALTLSFKQDTSEVESLPTQLSAHSISALYCACSASDAGAIVAKSGAIAVYGPDALLVPQYWETAGAAAEGTLVSFPFDPNSGPDARRLGPGIDALSYAAVQIFAVAAKGNVAAPAILTSLKSGFTFHTVIGDIGFDAKGDVQPQRFVWYKWVNGKYAAESVQ
jgi:branched-chain amino acid transport system substrate-binding protein